MTRESVFRISVRKFTAFEQAIAAQWADFESSARTDLALEAIPLDLIPLEQSLLTDEGMKRGDWDVCFIATDWIAAMHATGAALDLAPHLKLEPGAWPDSLLRLQRVGSALLGIPYHDGPECLIYRNDLFDAPENQSRYQNLYGEPLAPPKTWTDFHRIARFFHAPEHNLYGTVFAAYPDGHNTVYDFLLQLWTRGGELFDSAGNLQFETSVAAEALNFYREILADTFAIHPGSNSFDSVQAGLAFARGEAAMTVNWFGFAAMAQISAPASVKVNVTVIPGNPSVSLNVYWILSVAAGSPHRDVAVRFLQHCLTPAMDKLTTTSGAIGCRKSTWTDPAVNAQLPFYHQLESLHARAREIPRRADWPAIAAIIDRLVTAAITSSTPVGSLLEQANRESLKLLGCEANL
jgi:multiple sugar transport system substrate-binding protein